MSQAAIEGTGPRDPISALAGRPLDAEASQRLLEFQRVPGASEAVYLSTPITTGPRLLHWLANRTAPETASATNSEVEVLREEVIEENLSRLVPVRRDVRARHPRCHLIDPTELTVPDWNQSQYHRFWIEILRVVVDRMVLADGWHLSTGCVIEYATALEIGLPMEDASGRPLTPELASALLRDGAQALAEAGRDRSFNDAAADRADLAAHSPLKDAELARLAEFYNVASFVSTTPDRPFLRYQVLPGPRRSRSMGLESAIEVLLRTSRSGSINVRTFRPGVSKGNPFHYGLDSVASAMELIDQYARDGYYCIVNETIDIHDGGVSGVTLGGIAEFAPDDTPRVVENGDTTRLPIRMAEHVLRTVYGENLELPHNSKRRIEFSVHPYRVGHRSDQVIVWESEAVDAISLPVDIDWPNRFSRLLGDKTFGLLVAEAVGAPVPATTVVSRRIAPFAFGRETGTHEWWMRTAPGQQTPGRFPTTRGWSDPFDVVATEDSGTAIAAVLSQEGVAATFSGASLPRSDGDGHVVEGVQGDGSDFMLGQTTSSTLPSEVENDVQELLRELERALGSGVRIEWARDAETTWVLQLHRTRDYGRVGVFSEGEASIWLPYDPASGLDALGEVIEEAQTIGAGIEVVKPIGLTSHVGDLLRKAKIPGRLAVRDGRAEPASPPVCEVDTGRLTQR